MFQGQQVKRLSLSLSFLTSEIGVSIKYWLKMSHMNLKIDCLVNANKTK